MKTRIAVFDFDGTLTRKDSLLVFIRYTRGRFRFITGFIFLSPWLVAMKAGLISNQRGKEIVLQYFFGGMSHPVFDDWCRKFAETQIPSLIRPGALEEIRRLRQENVEVVVVSASPENWLQYWTRPQGLLLIGTLLQVSNGRMTGRIEGNNCHGTEKVRRIREKYPDTTTEIIAAYGDTKGDLPMLEMAQKSHWKPFR